MTENVDTANALSHLGAAHFAAGRYEQAIQCLMQEERIRSTVNDPLARANVSFNLGRVYSVVGNSASAVANYKNALQHLSSDIEKSAAKAFAIKVLSSLGTEYSKQTTLRGAAVEAFREALEIARAIGDKRRESGAYRAMGRIHLAERQWSTAASEFQCASNLARQLNDRASEATGLSYLASAQIAMGETTAGTDTIRHALNLAKTGSKPQDIAIIAHNAAVIHFNNQDPVNAIRFFAEELEFRDQGATKERARALKTMADAYIMLQDTGSAITQLEGAAKIYDDLGDQDSRSTILAKIQQLRVGMRGLDC